jgi:hypothetical protein
VLGAGQTEVFAQHFEEGLVDGGDDVPGFAVDGERELRLHPLPSIGLGLRGTNLVLSLHESGLNRY